MNAYLWRNGDSIVHHIRAASVAEVRERIAATHGGKVAGDAVIKLIRRWGDPEPAAA
jgi:hypothetical protein